ncbi:MAG: calcium/sodium antiporter [Calditrichaeota bacterium]|nr:calcium/sodium antiporter [Calditrichota bacterium]
MLAVEIGLILLGFLILFKAGDMLVDNAAEIARYFGMSELMIGLTIVAFGTSAPELMVNINAAMSGINDFVFGNVFGSNIINILIGLGIIGVFKAMKVQLSTLKLEIPFLFVITVILSVMLNDQYFFSAEENILSRLDGIILIVLFLLFLVYSMRLPKAVLPDDFVKPDSILKPSLLFILAAGLLWLGSDLSVTYSELVGKKLGVSEAVMGIFVLALGTSLPEIAVGFSAMKKQSSDLAMGNIVGSNIFNILLVLGITAVLSPPTYSTAMMVDLYMVNLAVILLFFFIFIPTRFVLGRFESSLMLIAYFAYGFGRLFGWL